jgi:hypothetical protein
MNTLYIYRVIHFENSKTISLWYNIREFTTQSDYEEDYLFRDFYQIIKHNRIDYKGEIWKKQ